MDSISKYFDLNKDTIFKNESAINKLSSNADLSYSVLNNLDIIDKKIIQSKLDGSIIKNCIISNTNMSRCDLNTIRVENCKFYNVDFSAADIMSSIFINCTFIDCSFDEAHISECDFIGSEFVRANMSNCGFLKSIIKNVVFTETNFEKSTILLNKYYHTTFNNMTLGNCTFMYHIMRNCAFNSVGLNTDSLAYLYGCTQKQLESVKLIFLGKEINGNFSVDDDFIDKLFKGFVEKHWYLGALLLKMNFNCTSVFDSLNLILELFIKQVECDLLLKADEMRFVVNVISDENNIEGVPTLVLENFINKILAIINNTSDKNRAVLSELMNETALLKVEQDNEIQTVCSIVDRYLNIKADIVFLEKPQIDPMKFISDINTFCSCEIKIIEYRSGSFIVEVMCAASCFVAFVKIIKTLTGNLLTIYDNCIQIREIATNPEYRRIYNESVLTRDIKDAKTGNKNVRSIFAKADNMSSTMECSHHFSYVTSSTNYGGYGKSNLYRVEIKEGSVN